MPVDGAAATARASTWLPGEPRALALLALFLAALYFGFFNHDFSVDGLRYATQVEQGGPLFHPNHLLPNAIFWLAWRCVQCFADVRAIWVMQALNALLGIATALCLARALARGTGMASACATAALYAVGFAAWNFAQEPEVYVLPAFAVAASLAVLWRCESIGWPRLISLALLAVFAVLCLQQYVLWYPALLALLWRHDLGAARRGKLAFAAIVVPLACFVAYLAVAWCHGAGDDAQRWAYWFLGYASDGGREGGYWPMAPARRALAVLAGLGGMVVSHDAIASPFALFAAALAAVAVIALAWLRWRDAVALPRQPRRVLLILAAFALLNLLFGAWWAAGDIEFLPPVWLALCAIVGLAGARAWRGTAMVAALVALVNLGVAFAPQRDWPGRYRAVAQLARSGGLVSGDVLIAEELNTVGYLDYFAGIAVQFQPGAVSTLVFPQADLAAQRERIEQALHQGRRVFTAEHGAHDRLYHIAALWAHGRRFERGEGVDGALATLYDGLVLAPTAAIGVEQVTLPIR